MSKFVSKSCTYIFLLKISYYYDKSLNIAVVHKYQITNNYIYRSTFCRKKTNLMLIKILVGDCIIFSTYNSLYQNSTLGSFDIIFCIKRELCTMYMT